MYMWVSIQNWDAIPSDNVCTKKKLSSPNINVESLEGTLGSSGDMISRDGRTMDAPSMQHGR
jgi:hypothetical protein